MACWRMAYNTQHLTALLLASMLEALCDKIAFAVDDFLLIAAQCRAVQPCISNTTCLLHLNICVQNKHHDILHVHQRQTLKRHLLATSSHV